MTGKALERFVRDILLNRGYEKVKPAFFLDKRGGDQPFFAEQKVICQSIYDTDIKCDFLLYHPEKYPNCLAIEAKWQQSGGSVDEKYPYLVANIQEKYPCPAWIVLDGKGYKPAAEKWLKRQVSKDKGLLRRVVNMSEFQKAVNNDEL